MELPPRNPDSVRWHELEIHRLQCALDVANTHHVVLVQEMQRLRRLLFEERACNNVINSIERMFGEAIGDAKAKTTEHA